MVRSAVRITKSIFRTQRDDPSEAETASHRLLLRAGMIQQVASGVYAYGPLAQRSLMKIQAVIRDEMEKAGAQEVNLPVLQPAELWERSGRAVAFGPDLFRLADVVENHPVENPLARAQFLSHLLLAVIDLHHDLLQHVGLAGEVVIIA